MDDGSTDHTGEIADVYATIFPDIVKMVHKQNGGHGSGVNAGLKLAGGTYFKVVDSDDWLDEEAYQKVLEELKHFGPAQYLIMHALIFRTDLLRRTGVQLPEHTFYVDNLFAYQPLPNVESVYYMDVNLYHYFLGREDQSINEKVLMNRIDQQIKVTELVADCVVLKEVKDKTPKLAAYMYRNVSIMMAISSIHLLLIGTEEAYEKREKLWKRIKNEDKGMYYRLRFTTISGFTYLPGKLGKKVTLGGYRAGRSLQCGKTKPVCPCFVRI